jgi:hypothetical protein
MKAADRVARGFITAVAVWGLPASAWACPVCFAAKDEANRVAFVASTVFLTALPLILMGAFIAWAARRAKALDAPAIETDSEPNPAEPSRVVSLASAEADRVPAR